MTSIEHAALKAWAQGVKVHGESESARYKELKAEYHEGQWAGQAIMAERLLNILEGK